MTSDGERLATLEERSRQHVADLDALAQKVNAFTRVFMYLLVIVLLNLLAVLVDIALRAF